MPTEISKIFISYSWADREIVWPLAESLRVKGLEVWIDKREIRPGDRITEQVQKALVECGDLLLMWSQSSSLSDYVRDEWNAALAYHRRIIPCRLDGAAIPGKLSDVLYVDLRDHAKGVEDLLRVLPPPVQRVREHDETRRRDDGLQIENIPYRENPNFMFFDEAVKLRAVKFLLVFESDEYYLAVDSQTEVNMLTKLLS